MHVVHGLTYCCEALLRHNMLGSALQAVATEGFLALPAVTASVVLQGISDASLPEFLAACAEAAPHAGSARLIGRKSSLSPHRSEPGGRLLYILSGALTTYSIEESQAGAEKAPVPPCILPVEDGTSQVSLEVDDRRAPPLL